MGVAPNPAQIFDRAVEEGERRLDQTWLELVSTGFIAGFTIVFGVIAMGIVHAAVEPEFGDVAKLAGAVAFGIGLVFLIVGRTELFTEDFFDPVATAFDRWRPGILRQLLRLWILTLIFNLTGAGLFALVFLADGVLPTGAEEALGKMAEEIAGAGALAGFLKAIVGGALVTLLSFLLVAVDGIGSRIIIAWFVGFLLAVGPFDHVVITALHLFFGILFGADVGFTALATTTAIAMAGNFIGGLGLVTLSHIAQAQGARDAGE